MPSRPTQGGSSNTWGTELNAWLDVALPQFNVKLAPYNAVGDGSTNDYAAIQAAIDAANAAGAGIVYSPRGTYSVSTAPSVKTGVRMIGDGIDRTIFKSGASNVSALSIAASASDVTIRDVTVNGNRAAFPAGGAAALGCAGNVTNLELTNMKATNAQAFSVFLDTTSGSYTRGRIVGCIFEDSGNGFDTFGSGQLTDFVFTGCVWRNTTGQGFATTNSTGGVTLQGCFFEGPMGNAISGEPISRLTVTGCEFHNLGDGTIGIYVHPIAGLTSDPAELQINGNLFYNTGTVSGLLTDNAIFLRNVSHATISGNTIRRMGRSGIVVSSATVANSANTVRAVSITGNVVTDSNQDNAGSTPNVLVDNNAGTLTDVVVSGNVLSKSEGSSAATHGVLEQGTPTNCLYTGNDTMGVGTAGVGLVAGSTSRVSNNLGFNEGIETIASAATISPSTNAILVTVTGTTTITSVTATRAGHRVTLVFSGVLTFTDGSNLRLAGNFVTTADDAITLVCDGTNWYETSRSVN